jgi:hypothetical protein
MIKANYTKIFSHPLWWQLAVLFLVSTASVYVGLSFNEKVDALLPEVTLQPSIFNKRASGLSGLFEIAEKRGLACQPWQDTYRELKNVHGLLLIASPNDSLTAMETDQILTWVGKGNALIYFDQFNSQDDKRALKKLGLAYSLGKKLTDKTLSPCPKANNCAYVEHFVLSGDARVNGGQEIAKDEDGALLSEVSFGKGRILIGTTPQMCANRQLSVSSFDNFQYLMNWLSTAPGSIFFDERCHGYSNSTNIFAFLLKEPAGHAFMQLLLIVTIAVAGGAQRFGEVKELETKRKISSLQFVDGLANAYERARANLAALEIIVQDFKTKLCKELAISPHSSKDEIAHACQIQTGKDSSNLLNFLTDYELACNQKKISATELKKYVLKRDQLDHEIKNPSYRNRRR